MMHLPTHRPPLVYILAPSYSGSTLLTLLLATHPDVATVGELKATAMGDVDAYRCSCGALIGACEFWRKVQRCLHARGEAFAFDAFGTDFDIPDDGWVGRCMAAPHGGMLREVFRQGVLRLHPRAREAWASIVRRNEAFVETVLSLSKARVFVDASKEPIRLRYLQAAGRWDLFVIHLLRDGRGQSLSAMRHEGLSMSQAAWQWRRTQQASLRVLQMLRPARQVRIRYEALCREPADTMRRLFSAAGLRGDGGQLNFRTVPQHILGNAMRLKDQSEIRVDERWREELGPRDLATFERIAGRWNQRLGYTVEAGQ